MSTATADIIERERKINIALNWKSAEELKGSDHAYDAFIKVMLYRREIAQRIVKSNNEKTKDELYATLEYCNDKIKQILGL